MESNMNNNSVHSNIWTHAEIQKVFSTINIMNLSNDLTFNNDRVESSVLNVISNALANMDCHKTTEEVETLLLSLRMSYLKCKNATSNKKDDDKCPYYNDLEKIWNPPINLNTEKEKFDIDNENVRKKIMTSLRASYGKALGDKIAPWSTKETDTLLNLIDELNLIPNFRYRLSPPSIEKLVNPMKIFGYKRTCSQILDKMRKMRVSYLRCVRAGSTPQDMENCPYYTKIDTMFKKLLKINNPTFPQPLDHDYGNKVKFSTRTSPGQSNQSDTVWKPPGSLSDNQEIFSESLDISSNDNPLQNCEKEAEGGVTSEDIVEDESRNNISEKNCMNYSNIDIKREINDLISESTLKNHVVSLKLDKRQANKRIPESEIPKFIKVVKGKTKFILKKMETPPKKSRQPPSKRLRSSIKKSNSELCKSPPSDSDDYSIPNNARTPGRLKHELNMINSTATDPLLLPQQQTNFTTLNESAIAETMKVLMKQMLEHQEKMQEQHHAWMEKQFEIQRNHDRERNVLLLKELQEFRQEFRDVAEQLFSE